MVACAGEKLRDGPTMQIRVLYFAIVRERLGVDQEELDVDEAADVASLRAAIEARHPAIAGLLERARFAVNEEFARADSTLSEGDTVAVIPPVAGGSDRKPAAERVAIRSTPLSYDEVIDLVRRPSAGALATFVGWVRDHSDGREVTRLEYSAYESMALAEMARIVEELEAETPELRLAAHHRVGALSVGDEAVICAASSPHRGEAFVAGRALIDRIKDRVPIWKKEEGPDGVAWVGSEDPPEPTR